MKNLHHKHLSNEKKDGSCFLFDSNNPATYNFEDKMFDGCFEKATPLKCEKSDGTPVNVEQETCGKSAKTSITAKFKCRGRGGKFRGKNNDVDPGSSLASLCDEIRNRPATRKTAQSKESATQYNLRKHRRGSPNRISTLSVFDIRRLARKAGVVRLQSNIVHGDQNYREILGSLKAFLKDLIGNAIAQTEKANRSTVHATDVAYALRSRNITVNRFSN